MCFLFTQLIISFGQLDLTETLNCRINQSALKENNIKSLVIYADFNEDGIDKKGGYGGKIAEFEFNVNGFLTYKLISNNHGNLPFIEYARGSYAQLYAYDTYNNLISTYTENYKETTQEIKSFNPKGRTTGIAYINDADTMMVLAYEWEEDKMIGATLLYINAANRDRINRYDEKGRLVKSSSENYSTSYAYMQKDEMLTTTAKTYRADTLWHTQVLKTHMKFNRIISYIKRDYAEELLIEMKAEVDESGNATYYYVHDYTDKYSNNEVYPPFNYTIKNVYDNRNLLIKRIFYFSRNDVGKDILVRIEHYIYGSEALPFKVAKGSLIRDEEMEMIDSMGE